MSFSIYLQNIFQFRLTALNDTADSQDDVRNIQLSKTKEAKVIFVYLLDNLYVELFLLFSVQRSHKSDVKNLQMLCKI